MVSPKGLKCWSFRFLFSVYACALKALHCCQFVEPGFKSTKERGRPVPLRCVNEHW